MPKENNQAAWKHLYDKYAPAMFGLICELTEDKLLAERIFVNTFLDLKQKQTIQLIEYAPFPNILRSTYTFTTKYLKTMEKSPNVVSQTDQCKLLYLLTTRCNTLDEATSILHITVRETKNRLHTELLASKSTY